MKYLLSPAVLLLAIGWASGAEPKLDGDYQAVGVTRDGKDEAASVVNSITLKINGDEWTFTVKKKSFPAKIKLDPRAKPAAIDIAPSQGPEKGLTFLGIYRFEKGELQIAFAERGDRPTEFKGEGATLLIRLKKVEKQ